MYEEIKNNINIELNNFNYTYQGFYNLQLIEQNNTLYIVDEYENFYYGGQDFDNCIEQLTNSLIKITDDKELYLECEIIGRWIIVSDKLKEMNNEIKI